MHLLQPGCSQMDRPPCLAAAQSRLASDRLQFQKHPSPRGPARPAPGFQTRQMNQWGSEPPTLAEGPTLTSPGGWPAGQRPPHSPPDQPPPLGLTPAHSHTGPPPSADRCWTIPVPRREGLEHHSPRGPHPSEAPHSDGTQRTGVGGLGPAAGHAPSCGVHALPSELDQAPGGTRFAWPQPTRRKVAPLPPPHPRHGSGHTCPGFLSLPPQALCMCGASSAASLATSPGPPFAVPTPDAT